jgi:hypothetical protein
MPDQLIQLYRDEPIHPGGPVTADVPLSEVESWQLAGWRIASDPKHKEKPDAKAYAEAETVRETQTKTKRRINNAD